MSLAVSLHSVSASENITSVLVLVTACACRVCREHRCSRQDKGLKRREGDDDDEEPDRQSERGSRASKKSKQSQQVGGRSFVRKCYTCGKTATDTQSLGS